jgi:hypothetical protein
MRLRIQPGDTFQVFMWPIFVNKLILWYFIVSVIQARMKFTIASIPHPYALLSPCLALWHETWCPDLQFAGGMNLPPYAAVSLKPFSLAAP